MPDEELIEALKKSCEKLKISVKPGKIWTIASMFSYNQKNLTEKRAAQVLGVDGEMAGVLIMKEWLNKKYGKELGKLKYGNLFYVADIVPNSSEDSWQSILDNPEKLLPLKKQGLKIAINALKLLNEKS